MPAYVPDDLTATSGVPDQDDVVQAHKGAADRGRDNNTCVTAGQTAIVLWILPLKVPVKIISQRLHSRMINPDRTGIRLLG